jgi:hypothetical protein
MIIRCSGRASLLLEQESGFKIANEASLVTKYGTQVLLQIVRTCGSKPYHIVLENNNGCFK